MGKKYKLVMKVPKPPESAYDHKRFISSLIQHQIRHFHDVEKSLLKDGQRLTDISKIKTELQASKYLEKMTALLHPQGSEKPRRLAKRKKATTRKRIVKRAAKTKKAKRRAR
jgi:hypothetical protein